MGEFFVIFFIEMWMEVVKRGKKKKMVLKIILVVFVVNRVFVVFLNKGVKLVVFRLVVVMVIIILEVVERGEIYELVLMWVCGFVDFI